MFLFGLREQHSSMSSHIYRVLHFLLSSLDPNQNYTLMLTPLYSCIIYHCIYTTGFLEIPGFLHAQPHHKET